MAPSNLKAIPSSVLDLLKHQWKEPGGYSSFDAQFNDREDLSRRRDPSYYLLGRGREVKTDFDVISHKEAESLVKQKVFGNLAVANERRVAINEHVQHALTDFCSEAYAAWSKYLSRLQEIERVGVFPDIE